VRSGASARLPCAEERVRSREREAAMRGERREELTITDCLREIPERPERASAADDEPDAAGARLARSVIQS
jgi:hypothetical protein